MKRMYALVTIVTGVVALAGCGAEQKAVNEGNGYPMTVTNCGRKVTIERKPERIIALGPSEVTSLYAAGGASRIVGRDDAGEKSAAYTSQIRAAVAKAPQLGTGGELSREALLAKQPDLVVGSVSESITPSNLSAVGIPMISLRGNCGSNHAPGASDGTADFDDVVDDVRTFGRLMGTTDVADRSVAEMRRRVGTARTSADLRGRSAATVIVFNSTLEIYGRRSMAHTQFTELGAKDVFADSDDRVFQASLETLVQRNPSVVMLLSYGQTDEQARRTFLNLPGAGQLDAVRRGAVFVQPYEYSSQGVLSVDGIENMARHFATSS